MPSTAVTTILVNLVLLSLLSVLRPATGFVAPSWAVQKHRLPSLLPLPRATSTTARYFKNFDEMLEQLDVPVLVDFYAQWCGPCVMMQPVLEDVAGRLDNVAKVAKVDTDKSPRLGSRYQVEALPTLILFYKGQVIDKYIGFRNADDLEREVRASMARIPDLPK